MRFHEQIDDKDTNIMPDDDWTLDDYKDMFKCINVGYLVQIENTYFEKNEEWEGDDFYEETFGEIRRIQQQETYDKLLPP